MGGCAGSPIGRNQPSRFSQTLDAIQVDTRTLEYEPYGMRRRRSAKSVSKIDSLDVVEKRSTQCEEVIVYFLSSNHHFSMIILAAFDIAE